MLKINEPQDGHKTLIVLGNARGGTSLVSGVLRELGVFMGNDVHINKHEWAFFDDARANTDLIAKIAYFNGKFTNWGFKKPEFIYEISSHIHKFRNPHVVVVYRSTFDVLNSDFKRNMVRPELVVEEHTAVLSEIAKFISTTNYPVIILGYEALLKNAREEIMQMVDYLGVEINPEKIANAIEFSRHGTYSPVSGQQLTREEESRLEIDQIYESLVLRAKLIEKRNSRLNAMIIDMLQDTVQAELIVNQLCDSAEIFTPTSYKESLLDADDLIRRTNKKLSELASLEDEVAILNEKYLQKKNKFKAISKIRMELQKEMEKYVP